MHFSSVYGVEIYGLIGPIGCGKTSAVKAVRSLYPGLPIAHHKFSDPLTAELKKRGMELTRVNYDNLVLEWDDQFGPNYLSHLIALAVHDSIPSNRIIFADGVRRIQDVDMLKEIFPKHTLIYITADQRRRWEFITQRDERPIEHKISWSEFQVIEELPTNRQLQGLGEQCAHGNFINDCKTAEEFNERITVKFQQIRRLRGWAA